MLMGHQWMTVRTFVVEHGVDSALPGTLVDAGLACMAPRLAELASTRGIKRCVVTHHHEDHCGGAAALTDAGVDVHASARTAALMQPSGQGCGVPGDGAAVVSTPHVVAGAVLPHCTGAGDRREVCGCVDCHVPVTRRQQ